MCSEHDLLSGGEGFEASIRITTASDLRDRQVVARRHATRRSRRPVTTFFPVKHGGCPFREALYPAALVSSLRETAVCARGARPRRAG
jgi:hypothetical protein